jgi:hypothetical protein
MLDGAMLVLSVANALAIDSKVTNAIPSQRCKSLQFIVRFLSCFFLAILLLQVPEAGSGFKFRSGLPGGSAGSPRLKV